MKSHHIVHRLLFFLSLTLFGSVNVWAYSYYAKVTAHAYYPTGAGTVYAQSNDNNDNNNGTEGQSSTATGETGNSGGDVSFTFRATPKDDYDFIGWANDENTPIESIELTDNPYTTSYKAATRTGENSASDYNIYAYFAEKPLFYFSGTAEVSPSDAGSASVSPPSVSVRGEKRNSISATTSLIEFSATANSSYHFMGWSETANGTIVNTDNPYTPTLTSTSNDSNNPTNTTLYARFQPYPTGITASPSSIVIGTGDTSSPITVSVSPAGAYENFEFESSNPAIATVNGTGMVTGVAAGTTTITISSLKDDGTTVVSTTVTVTVQAKAATPVISFVPIGDGSTATATITCATTGTIIHYKVNDGAEQTYSSAFTVNADDQVEAWATMADVTLWLDSDHVTATYAICVTDEPTISYTQWDGTATVTIKAETGATIYYTTNGSTPIISSSSGTTPVTISGLANGTVVKAFAKSSSCRASAIVSKTLIVTGTSNNVVTINDLEDHTWSYYQNDANLPDGYPKDYLSSPEPRNVKITYRGGEVSGASAVAISALDTEDQNEMVYYKTMEKTVLGMTGNYPYTVISNPFSKRPKVGNTYYGFGGWKVISGGEYILEYSNEDTLPLDETIHFTNLDNNYTTNCMSAEIVFEATWVVATIKTGNSAPSFTGGTYETNFWVLTENPETEVTVPGNCTMTARYPDGEVCFADNFTRAITAGGDNAKVEFVNMNSTNIVYAANYTFTMGRGIVNSGNGGDLRGATRNATAIHTVKIESGTYSNMRHFNIGIDASKPIDQLMILGCDYDRAKNDNSKLKITGAMYVSNTHTLNRSSGNLFVRGIVKSGTFQENISGTYTATAAQSYYFGCYGSNNRSAGHRYLVIEGGSLRGIAGGTDHTTNQQEADPAFTLRIKGNQENPIINGAIYGAAENAKCKGRRTMIFTGGKIKGWIAGAANGTSSSDGDLEGATYIYFGGNAQANSGESKTVINRAIGGNVFAAGCGYDSISSSGTVSVGTNVVVADNAYIERGVYGGGSYGYTTATSNIYILGGTVDGKDGGVNGTSYEASITGGVYGGACQNQGGTAKIYMTGGQVNGGIYGGSNVTGTLSGSVTMHIDGGQVGTSAQTANIHGGGYGQQTTISGDVDLTLGTTSQTTDGVTVYGDVYGGSALGTVNTNTSNHTNVTLNKGTIYGSLYGGALGSSGAPGSSAVAANVNGPVTVTVNGGSVKPNPNDQDNPASIFGCNNEYGSPQSTVAVVVNGTDATVVTGGVKSYAINGVYGGGNQAHYTYDNSKYPTVTISGCSSSIKTVYGGGNAAAVPSTHVTINGGDIDRVFGGGNGDNDGSTPAHIGYQNKDDGSTSSPYTTADGNVSLTIHGGTINQVFGGSNAHGLIKGSSSVNVEKSGDCDMHITELYGGGNEAAGKAGKITIGCTGGATEGIGDVYGGARAADVTGSIDLEITGGSIQRVFGGNNISGSISGDIKVDIDWNTEACGHNYLGYVYGAGNQADFDKNTTVNMKQGTVTHDVYGGGLEAAVAGNVVVNVTGGTVQGDLYGGGALANTNTASGKTTQVNLVGGTVNNVYGGGLGQMADAANGINAVEALVGGDVTITLNGSTATGATNNCVVTGNIFGCNNVNGTPKGHVKVHVCKTAGNGTTQVRTASDKLDSSTESDHKYEVAAVYGGGNMAAYEPARTIDYAEVVIDGCSDTSIGYVYGGGNAASVPATSVTINGAYEIGYVFGGGNGKDRVSYDGGKTYVDNPGANVGYKADGEISYGSGTATVNALGGKMHHVFGGSNTKGNVRESSVVYLDEGSSECDLAIDEVYGGGNEAQMDGDSQINLGCITYMKEIYGGAKSADLGGDVVLTITSGHFDRVFGGNNVSGDINGSITVNVEETGCHPVTIGELYGCGNQAPYSTPSGKTDPTVNIKSFTSIGRVFGGGLGAKAIVTGNPTVNINEVVGDNATTTSSAYAGTTRTLSDGSTVTLPAHASGAIGSIGTVFGGGNAAQVVGNTNVNIGTLSTVDYVSKAEGEETPRTAITVVGANVTGNVFGGGNQAQVTGNTNVVIGK